MASSPAMTILACESNIDVGPPKPCTASSTAIIGGEPAGSAGAHGAVLDAGQAVGAALSDAAPEEGVLATKGAAVPDEAVGGLEEDAGPFAI